VNAPPAGGSPRSSRGRALPPLTAEERRALLRLARLAVIAAVTGVALPDPAPGEARLREPQGAFVTLQLHGDLHGCIGMVDPVRPLAETVAHCAAAAATEDPRFPPLLKNQVEQLSIEITALQPLFEVHDPAEIVLGRHGLVVARGGHRGVLLPQVAVEHGFDVETFVRETVRKAGLPPDAISRGGAALLAFEAEIFSEGTPGATGSGPGSPLRSRAATG